LSEALQKRTTVKRWHGKSFPAYTLLPSDVDGQINFHSSPAAQEYTKTSKSRAGSGKTGNLVLYREPD
jgi:hypothetical protein